MAKDDRLSRKMARIGRDHDRTTTIMQLVNVHGKSLFAISRELELNPKTVTRLYRREMEKRQSQNLAVRRADEFEKAVETVETVQGTMLEYLVGARAAEPRTVVAASAAVLKCVELKSALFGLNAPVEIETVDHQRTSVGGLFLGAGPATEDFTTCQMLRAAICERNELAGKPVTAEDRQIKERVYALVAAVESGRSPNFSTQTVPNMETYE